MGAVASDALAERAAGESQGLPSSGISGIVFDVPDVVYDATLWRRWLFQLLVRTGVAPDYSEFHDCWERQLSDVHCGRREFGEALQGFLLGYGLSWAQVDEVEAASRIQRQRFEIDVRPLPGVASTIRTLNAAGMPLIAWADTPLTSAKLSERLDRILPRAEFQAVVTSFEVELSQPDSKCYRVMRDALPATGPVLYVGHDAVHLAAAREAGLLTAALSYLPTGQVDFALSRLEELAAIATTRRNFSPPCLHRAEQSPVELSMTQHGAGR